MKLRHFNWPRLNSLALPSLDIKSYDINAILSRSGVIMLMIMVFMYAAVGVFYKSMSLIMIRNSGEGGTAKVSPSVALNGSATDVIRKEPLDSFKIITERNLFGSTDKAVVDRQGEQGGYEASDTVMNIELKGTIAGDRKYGFAVIEEKGKGKQGLYRVGDSVGAMHASPLLVQIRRNSVVLRVGDQEKILKMPERNEAPIFPPGATLASAAPVAPVIASGAITINKNEIASTMNDMGAMLTQAQIRPYFLAGASAGFMISNIRPGGIFQKMRLVEGDVIQGINNIQIKTADDIVEFYNMLKSGSNINLKIRRQGRQESLSYVFQ